MYKIFSIIAFSIYLLIIFVVKVLAAMAYEYSSGGTRFDITTAAFKTASVSSLIMALGFIIGTTI